MLLNVKRLTETACLPTYASTGSAGMDLYADIKEDIVIESGKATLIPTGIAISLPSNEYAAFIYARSGLAIKYGIIPGNCVGVIDSDYRGEIKVGLTNLTNTPYTVTPHERIGQMVISPVFVAEIVECDELDDTDRGAGGFGSTGKK